MPVYDVTYENLSYTHPVIYTAAKMGEYIPSKKRMKMKRNLSFTLSSTKERSLEPHKICHPENNWETRIW